MIECDCGRAPGREHATDCLTLRQVVALERIATAMEARPFITGTAAGGAAFPFKPFDPQLGQSFMTLPACTCPPPGASHMVNNCQLHTVRYGDGVPVKTVGGG